MLAPGTSQVGGFTHGGPGSRNLSSFPPLLSPLGRCYLPQMTLWWPQPERSLQSLKLKPVRTSTVVPGLVLNLEDLTST